MANQKRLSKKRVDKSKLSFFLIFCLPPLLLYVFYCVIPILQSLYTSFYDYSGYSELTSDLYVGFGNYIEVLSDPEFLSAIKNDFIIIAVKEVIICILTVLFAVSLTRLRFRKFESNIYRFLFYIPNVLSTIIIATIWTFVLDPNFGFLNPILEGVGLEEVIPATGWTYEHPLWVVSFVASWCGVGLFMLVMITAINGVSKELYESARLDGAGEWRQLWSITMPAVWRQTKFMVITILYQSFAANFGMVQALLGSNVNEESVVMGKFVYMYGYESFDPQIGYSYAAAIIMLIITTAISLGANKLMSKGDGDNG